MHNLMIGMYGGYDFKKFKRDFREDFYGVEACLFEREEDIDNLIIESNKNSFNYGIHFPLRDRKGELRDAQFLSLDKERKMNSLKIIKEENPNVKILFEHRSDLITDEELEACYEWVSSII